MDPNRHERVGQLFLRAQEMPESERAAFLDEACGDDGDLRREVESLLRAGAESLNLENVPGFDVREGVTRLDERIRQSAAQPSDSLPIQIGPYKCVSELGAGGFGEVYRAEQQSPVRRTVALKIIKLGMDTKEVMSRFAAERQALAMMDHPGIAKVFDAGTTDAGRPFFVMELVQGVPITRYCDGENLSTQARLELFIEVCNAIQHAHQKGIIHRDIKPNNVLVAMVDGRPMPKVIDFGIAKAIDVESAERSLVTRQHQMLGTPAYMSPEQADPSTTDIDTRSDVYALGVLLYELLTGTTPFAGDTVRLANYSEILRIIREDDPPKPSTRLCSLGPSLSAVAQKRRSNAQRLPAQIRGDLDWMVMKALDKDRARRYQTADNLGRDVQRFLNHEPVLASPPRTSDRLRKFVRRHRVGVAAASVVALALLVGTIGISISLAHARASLVRARDAEASAVSERDRAQREADKANAVKQFLEDMLAEANPKHSPDALEMTVPQMLDIAAERIDGAFADQPDIEAGVRLIMGSAYRELGRWDDSIEHLNAVIELVGDREIAAADWALGLQQLGVTYYEQGDYTRAEELLRQSLEVTETYLGAEHIEVARVLLALGAVHFAQTDYDATETCGRRALKIFEDQLGSDDLETHDVRQLLGGTLFRKRDYAGAEPLFRDALLAARRVNGDVHAKVATAANNLAVVLRYQDKFDEAERFYREAMRVGKSVYGQEHPFVATSLNNIARLHHKRGDLESAEPIYREALDMRRRVLPEDHYQIAETTCNLGELLDDAGRLEDSADLFEAGLAMERRIFGDRHQYVAMHAANLGIVYRKMVRLADAEPLLRESLDIHREVYTESRIEIGQSLFELALLRLLQGDEADSELLWQEGIEASQTAHAAGDDRAISAMVAVGKDFLDKGSMRAAEAVLRACVNLQPEGGGDRSTGLANLHLGRCLTQQNRFDEAEALLIEAGRILTNPGSPKGDEDANQVSQAQADLEKARRESGAIE